MGDQYQEKKNSLEDRFNALLDRVPLLKDYRGRERLRDQDKVLRVHTSEQITRIKDDLDSLKKALLSQGRLGLLDDLDELTRKLDRARDTHRFDAYGFSGLFDPKAVKEEALSQLYQYDLKILDQVQENLTLASGLLAGATEQSVQQALPLLREAVGRLLALVLDRKRAVEQIAS